MKVELSELKPNPFKKFISDGTLNEQRIDVITESIEHGTLPEHFFARRVDEILQLTSGHHRVEALKRVKGKDYKVEVTLVNYNDEQMLIDMVRENITQRDTDYHDTRESIILARSWLESESNSVQQFHKIKTVNNPKGAGRPKKVADCRSIAKFISKNGKTISYKTVSNYLVVSDNLAPELISLVDRSNSSQDREGKLAVTDAIAMSKIKDKAQQIELAEVIMSSDADRDERKQMINTFADLPIDDKEKVLEGKIALNELVDTQPKVLGTGAMSNKFNKKATELVVEMRSLRQTLFTFRKQGLFKNFSNDQRKSFTQRLSSVRTEYKSLIDELENSLEVLQ